MVGTSCDDVNTGSATGVTGGCASGIRGARKLVLPNTAHMVNLERPAEFNRAVAEFLDEHPIAS
ncbi:MAG: alpha/beta hydrolase [Chloroflexota bacterium]|nr:alpha/beta hydrolase [Chloroflexota bacterium]